MDFERRTYPTGDVELRKAGDDDDETNGGLTGRVTPFDVLSRDLGGFREKIAPGAFEKALDRSDVRGLFNHNPDNILGRTKAGTLRLEESDKGLEYEIDLPDTQIARDVAANVKARNITGNSFSFIVERDEWDYSDKKMAIRTVLEVRELFDVGPVTYPAYNRGTKVSTRSLEMAQAAPVEVTPDSRNEVARQRQAEAE